MIFLNNKSKTMYMEDASQCAALILRNAMNSRKNDVALRTAFALDVLASAEVSFLNDPSLTTIKAYVDTMCTVIQNLDAFGESESLINSTMGRLKSFLRDPIVVQMLDNRLPMATTTGGESRKDYAAIDDMDIFLSTVKQLDFDFLPPAEGSTVCACMNRDCPKTVVDDFFEDLEQIEVIRKLLFH